MRFIIDMNETEPGRIEGRVTRVQDHTTRSFFGWLELLSLLEPVSEEADDLGEPPIREPPHEGWPP